MKVSYTPPNVTVSEEIDRAVAPLIATPALIALVGPTAGAITRTSTITLTATDGEQDAVAIPVPAGSRIIEIVKVTDIDPALDGVYINAADVDPETDDYDFEFDPVAGTITRNSDSEGLPNGGSNYDFQGVAPDYEHSVLVTYRYVPENYFSPILLDNMPDIITRFGPAQNAAGDIVSPVTMAATLAFENGASQIVIQPLFGVSDNVRRQPTAPEIASPTIWEACIAELQIVSEVNIVVPVVGQNSEVGTEDMTSIFYKVQEHLRTMRNNEQEYGIAIFGNDGSEQNVSAETLRIQSEDIRARFDGDTAQQIVMVSPSKFVRRNRTLGKIIGGQYVAAALAGMIAARPVSTPLTRRSISGISNLAETRTKTEKNQDAQAGLTVIETVNDRVRVRHAITLDDTSTSVREISIIRAKHRVIESVRRTLDNQIIGQVIADGNAPLAVSAAVIGVLDQLRQEKDIVDYSDVQARVKTIDPTAIEVRFSYRPAFPVNYIDVVFSLDLSSNNIQLEG